MSMIRDALQYLKDLAQAAKQPETIDLPKNKLLIVTGGDQKVYGKNNECQYHHRFTDLVSFCRACDVYSMREIWLCQDQAVAIAADSMPDYAHEEYSRLTCDFVFTSEYGGLMDLGYGEAEEHEQADLLYILRRSLGQENADHFNETGLISAVKNLKSKHSSTGASTVDQGRMSVDRSVLSEVMSEGGALPESFAVALSMFDTQLLRDMTAGIIQVDLWPKLEQFKLVTKVDKTAVSRWREECQKKIQQYISENVPESTVYLGSHYYTRD